jgi:hypothetical protein
MVFMFVSVFVIMVFLNLYVVFRFLIDGICVVPLTPAKITSRGAIFHPSI